MKKICLLILCFVFLISSIAYADDVYVGGYYRKDGTYVRPHYRSSPNQYKWDNYGSRGSQQGYDTPYNQRDYDGDGIYNQYDYDDDNDNTLDDWE